MKKYSRPSSAAVLIGALRVKLLKMAQPKFELSHCHSFVIFSLLNRLEEVQGAETSSLFPPPFFQDMWPCVQHVCAEHNAPCQ